MALRTTKKQSEEPISLDEMFSRFRLYATTLTSSQWKARVTIASIISVLTIAASSVLYYFDVSQWICAFVGFPAGILLFFIGLGLIYRNWSDAPFFQNRYNRSFRSRLKIIIFAAAIFAAILIPSGTYIPYGIGGTLLIIFILSSVTFARRTEQEVQLMKEGLPDPRDLSDDTDEDEMPEVVPTTVSTDTNPDNSPPRSGKVR